MNMEQEILKEIKSGHWGNNIRGLVGMKVVFYQESVELD